MEYSFSGTQVRTVVLNGLPYFIAKDVCGILQLTNHKVAVQSLDEDERGKYCLPRQGETWIVNESGLYHLIFQSRKPEAKAFRRWVTSEVLPELRKTGSYSTLPDVPCQVVNDRKMFPFHLTLQKLGYLTGGSAYYRKLRYPGQFIKIGRILFASEEMCRLMAASRRVLQMRRSVADMQPVLGAAVENTLFGYGKA